MRKIILASASPYRRQLLTQLQLPFEAAAPDFTETYDPAVAPTLLVRHLALGKAQSLCQRYPDALIIGSDQVFVDQRGRALGKPGGFDTAFQQLRQMSGRTHSFHTGLAVVDSRSGISLTDFETFSVTLRELSDAQIRTYLRKDSPFDCAGSFKIEGLGIALMEKMAGDDYNSLIGLPLIKLVTMLGEFGVAVLSH